MSSAVLSHSPSGPLGWVPYHFFSDPGPRNDQRPGEHLRAWSALVTEFAIQFSLVPGSILPYFALVQTVIKSSHFESR